MRKLNMLSAATMLCLTANLAFLPGIASAAHSSGKSNHRCEPTKIYNIVGNGGTILNTPTTVATFTAPSDCAYAFSATINVTAQAAIVATTNIICQFVDNGTNFGNIASSGSVAIAAGATITLPLTGFQPATSPFPDTFTVRCMTTGTIPAAFPIATVTGSAVEGRQADL